MPVDGTAAPQVSTAAPAAPQAPTVAPPPLPADLDELARLWPALPEAVRAGFVTTARALAAKDAAAPQTNEGRA